MNNPGTKHFTNETPWSAAREVRARNWGTVATGMIYAGAIVTVVGALMLVPVAVIVGGIWIFLSWVIKSALSAHLEKLLHNRPGSSTRYVRPQTEWVAHAGHVLDFVCKCGAGNTFIGKPKLENPLDPFGGRYVVNCRCGIGHYKIAGPNGRLNRAAS